MAIGSEESGYPKDSAKMEKSMQDLQTRESDPLVNHSTALRKALSFIRAGQHRQIESTNYPDRIDPDPPPNDPAYFLMRTRPMDWFRVLVKKIQNKPTPIPQAI